MLLPRDLNALFSIVAGLFVLVWTAPVVIAYDGSCDWNEINGPIGIDLGYQYITASYANSTTVFTPLAVVQSAEYHQIIGQLSAELYEARNLKALYGYPEDRKSIFGLLKILFRPYLRDLSAKIPYLDHPYAQAVISTTHGLYGHIDRFTKTTKSLVSWQKPTGHLALHEMEEALTRVFTNVKTAAKADTGTDIPFAVIGIPDSFNHTLGEIVVQAARKAGIDSVSYPIARTALTDFENPAVREGDSVLVIHQGIQHCGIRMWYDGGTRTGSRRGFGQRRPSNVRRGEDGGTPPDPYLPLEPWGSRKIYKSLTKKLIRSSEALATQLQVGADLDSLVSRVAMARMRLKRQDVRAVYVGLESYSAEFYTTLGAGDAEGEDGSGAGSGYLDEEPLYLDDWWVYGRNPGVNLTREMVEKSDEEYVKSLANSISVFVEYAASQSWRRDVVDQVAIMTDWMDGDLVRRAVEEALGESKPMIGGSFSDLTVAADGAARLALIRRQNLLEMQGYLAHGEL
ncbi:hypothetical protein BJX66DRAFT_345319 [Aspergillus keveii]|uniref:Uncharacterized protein n=1 Tax=Aspergillus keveii TaxID=714993 RepID=A0ABR4FIF8_9EURO